MLPRFLSAVIAVLFICRASAQDVSFANLATTKRGEYSSYQSKDGTVYKIGDKVKIGMPSSDKTFAFITTGDGVWTAIVRVQAGASGQESEIKKIVVDGSKRTGYFVYLKTKANIGLYTIQIENAVQTKEIVSSVMTSDEALSQLKKAKDKLDLGLITKEDYNALKEKLSKFIN